MEDRKKVTEQTIPEMLGAYASQDPARFHMPGHKGRGMGGFWRGDLIKWDVTELPDTDNLHMPSQAILYAERHMAGIYGARASFFVVNGGTAAVQAMILSLPQGEKLLLSRDAHRSAVAGAALRGIDIAYMLPPYDAATGLTGMITPEILDQRLSETGATAALLTSPNYYGLCADIPALSRVAHAHGALLLVDAAHGAHFPFSEALPTPLGGYADLWAHSQHKTMDALTQAASLHLGECRIAPETVRRMLMLVETTSPSYLLMASLDWSLYMAERQDWGGQVDRLRAFRRRIAGIEGIALLPENIGVGVMERDLTRLVLDVTGRGWTGFAAEEALVRAGVYCEMSDEAHLVFITSPEDDPDWYERLYAALASLPLLPPRTKKRPPAAVCERYEPERALLLHEAVFALTEQVDLSDATGRVAAESLGVYPPGIALTMPGERIAREVVQYLVEERAEGAALFGVRDGCVTVVKE